MWQQLGAIDRGESSEQNRHLDGAGSVEPSIGIVMKLEPRLEVVQGDSNCLRARVLLDAFDLASERELTRLRFSHCCDHRGRTRYGRGMPSMRSFMTAPTSM